MPQAIDINDVLVEDRFRKDLGDVQSMVESIKEFNLIQPIVVVHDVNNPAKFKLVAGGRRIAALRLMGQVDLEVGKHVIIRDEPSVDKTRELRLKGMELEENLKRKDMTWAEQVEAKRQLFELMEAIYGPTGAGGVTRAERLSGESTGFGVRKLAAMLGESAGTVSQDLQLAKMVKAMPHLAKEESKSSASRLGNLSLALKIAANEKAASLTSAPVGTVAFPESVTGAAAAAAPGVVPIPPPRYTLYEGRWQFNIDKVPDATIDLVYTDLPYGTDLDEMRIAGASDTSSGHSGAITYSDSREDIVTQLPDMMRQAYRVLKNDRFAVFFFGFNFYAELVAALRGAGFSVNCVPVVWIKHSQSAIAPTMRYANGYEQALVAMKGSPRFIRPGRPNLKDIPKISSAERLQFAQQPVDLPLDFIQDMTLPIGARVLDFCSGVGTTGVAAVKCGRFPVLFEMDPQQCLLIEQRLRGL